ncbi:efflux RND transporter periplasmic adaptor subunit [Maritimibacter sp. HL-12]|uniref:efflux RND transporter periplasmic adaptor subunit n=1 Tax=Maritimibacter sp. HL-12 TaxID=1162418 RepID=UPI000A0F29C0|nr:efflux RND transporter periplasmic adaptor subunit [Maritimibacter sp. HL-12]SMH30483.1 membrane fusion protein, multidrug efflux system [Maritimibacter sp. HL-12]
MRIIPIFTAIFAAAILFMLVFERDTVRALAGLAPAEAEASDTAQSRPEEGTDAPPDAAPDTGVSVVAFESRAREIDSAVVVRGRTEAARAVDLLAETSGRSVAPPIPKGTLVAEGDELCQIDIGTRAEALAEARARLAEAEANAPSAQARVAEAEARLEEAETTLGNTETLAAGGFAADTRVINARAAMRTAEAGLATAEAGAKSAAAAIEGARTAVANAEREIAHTRITAPFEGVLETDTAELGSLLQPGALCARVLDLDPIRLVGFVSEMDVDRVEPGAMAGARLTSGREVAGKVTFVSRSADPTTRTFRVEAEVANPDLAIRDGQAAEILIRAAGRTAHLVPQSALTLDDEGTLGVRLAVAEAEGDVARFVPVELLRDSNEGVFVAGLPEVARVIVVGQNYVADGVALAVTMQESGS